MAKCIVILGMHRSATSLVAKGLAAAGVHMGDVYLPHDSGNPEGYYEDIDFLNLNKSILIEAKSSWRNPPTEKQILELRYNLPIMNRVEKLVQKKQSHKRLWGWKEPRTVLTIPLYKPFLEEPIYVACYRNPEEVAKSLQKRNGMDIAEGIALADMYNTRIKNFLERVVK
jgi:hypothetical protein